MKWFSIAAIALALLIGCAYVMFNKQEEVIHLTEAVQKYMGRREALQKEISELEARRDKFESMRNEWIEHRKRAGELESLYGDKAELESACKALAKKRGKLKSDIEAYTNEIANLEKQIAELEVQTNALVKAKRRFAEERDFVMAQEREAKREYDKQKTKTEEETRRADEAAAKAAKNMKIAEEYQAKVEVAKADADAAVKVHQKRGEDAKKAANAESEKLAKLTGGVEDAQAKASALATEVAALEAMNRALAGVEKTLSAKKEELAGVEAKISKANAKVTAQQVSEQIDAVRDAVSKKLGAFEGKLKELDKKNDGFSGGDK